MTWLDGGLRIAIACVCFAATVLVSAVAALAAPDAPKNLISNGNAEQGEGSADGYAVVAEIPGWTRKGKFNVVSYGAPNGFPGSDVQTAVGGGSKFFAGGPANAGSAVTQDVNVASKKGLITAGKAKATLSGALGGYATQNDALVVTATFLSAAGDRLGVVKIGPVGAMERKTLTGMIPKSVTKPVPVQTRTVRVTLGASRTSGSYNDGYADNLSLTIGR
jgi:hypothetical protein